MKQPRGLPPRVPRTSSLADGFLFSVSLFTVVRVRARREPAPMRAALPWSVVVGLGIAAVAGCVLAASRALLPGTTGALVTAALVVAALAGMTRGLHLDGLADTADGFGRMGTPDQSLAVMHRSDIGPFGVVTLVLTLVLQIAALAQCLTADRGLPALLVAVLTGRVAMLRAGTPGVRAARPDGLGAAVAGSVPWTLALSAAVALVAGAAALPAAFGEPGLGGHLAFGAVAGLVAAELVLRRAVRRFGGVTGDVFGALLEVATTVALVVTALR